MDKVTNTKLPPSGVEQIAAERDRQQFSYGGAHDDKHDKGELLIFAALLSFDASPIGVNIQADASDIPEWITSEVNHHGDKGNSLEVAGALIAAEIDRRARAIAKKLSNVKALPLRDGYDVQCPACGSHYIPTDANAGPNWTFNQDESKPTFSPSVKVTKPDPNGGTPLSTCHFFIREGRIEFCGDCSHEYAGQNLELEPYSEADVSMVRPRSFKSSPPED